MNRTVRLPLLGSVLLLLSSPGVGAQAQQGGAGAGMSFFVTSVGSGNGADLGGLEGADRHCQQLARAAGAGDRTWRAYLSTQAAGGQPAVNARDRVGRGPWRNAEGVVIAHDLEELHGANNLSKETALTERGEVVNWPGDTPNMHDMLTGSQPDGTAFAGAEDRTCGDWAKGGAGGRGHARPPRPAGPERRSAGQVLELVAPLARRVQPGGAARHGRRGPVLLLRGGLKASRPKPARLPGPWQPEHVLGNASTRR